MLEQSLFGRRGIKGARAIMAGHPCWSISACDDAGSRSAPKTASRSMISLASENWISLSSPVFSAESSLAHSVWEISAGLKMDVMDFFVQNLPSGPATNRLNSIKPSSREYRTRRTDSSRSFDQVSHVLNGANWESDTSTSPGGPFIIKENFPSLV